MHIVNVPLPCALRGEKVSPDEVKALVNLIRHTASTPENRVTMDMVALALGVNRQTLWSWMRKARAKPGQTVTGRAVPYCCLYVLQVLAVNPAAARDDVFAPIRAALIRAA
ncbi:MAG: hypothetical protein V4641_05455 [Pseudomonadota bacterium]